MGGNILEEVSAVKKQLLIIFVMILGITIYICSGFYRIEHIYNEDGKPLITKKSEIERLLIDYNDAFNQVTDIIISDDADTHDYYYNDELLKSSNDFLILKNQCNVLWIRTNAYRNCITFYQTMDTSCNNTILLSYECTIDESRKRTWKCTNKFPKAKSKETLIMKLYNMLY